MNIKELKDLLSNKRYKIRSMENKIEHLKSETSDLTDKINEKRFEEHKTKYNIEIGDTIEVDGTNLLNILKSEFPELSEQELAKYLREIISE